MPSGQEYDQGVLLRVDGEFVNTATGALLDPTTIKFEFKKPGGTVTTYTYPTNTQLVREAAGIYHVDLDLDTPGWWSYRWYSTGTGQTAKPGAFSVKADPVS